MKARATAVIAAPSAARTRRAAQIRLRMWPSGNTIPRATATSVAPAKANHDGSQAAHADGSGTDVACPAKARYEFMSAPRLTIAANSRPSRPTGRSGRRIATTSPDASCATPVMKKATCGQGPRMKTYGGVANPERAQSRKPVTSISDVTTPSRVANGRATAAIVSLNAPVARERWAATTIAVAAGRVKSARGSPSSRPLRSGDAVPIDEGRCSGDPA